MLVVVLVTFLVVPPYQHSHNSSNIREKGEDRFCSIVTRADVDLEKFSPEEKDEENKSDEKKG